ncbi:NAD(P)-dependent dehydrogenase, short-chain alcohol dehydrogenase family [Agromyces sp. CF514]|uniref:SDR family oxidoreductase n=1 Tax=Agromyces sp. CF514 TaxID=1881031 RepID=UPI0008F27F9D|nr:SDR family oxidoreductase [Agromyces sp. CF514]SFR70842.1 NAD(P)-dependent dehydrogenase, short-chain alcohol dehydrogenase family [Agromyces sp. CF514]
MQKDVAVVIGVGGMGLAIARRIANGRRVVLADFNLATLEAAAAQLTGEGHDVVTRRVDVSDRASVAELADAAAAAGRVTHVAHTAGLSPMQAPTQAILSVDLLGVAHVLDEFPRVIAPGGAGVVISSMSAYFAAPTLPAELGAALATTPTDELLALSFLAGLPNPGAAYSVAKRANQLRVAAASVAWGEHGARINSISPGVISTPMGQEELAGDSGEQMRGMVAASAAKRLGTPDDIAAAAAFLLDPQVASFISGIDLLVDGGTVAGVNARGLLG